MPVGSNTDRSKDRLPVGWSIDCSMKWCLVSCIIGGSTDQLPVDWNIHSNTQLLLVSCVLLLAVQVGHPLACY